MRSHQLPSCFKAAGELDKQSRGCLSVESLLKFLPSPGQPRAIRFGVTIVLVAVFLLFSLGTEAETGRVRFFFLIPPVLFTSVLYDRQCGFLATGLSALALASQLNWHADPVGNLITLTTFAIIAWFIALFGEALRNALERGLAAQQELRLLLQEQRHRIKNDLALASSLIGFQARSQSSPLVRAALEKAVKRLQVIAQTQDHLQLVSGDQAVKLQEYLEELCWNLGELLRDVRPIAIRVTSDKLVLSSRQATRIGLIVNELVTNALKYAFPEDNAGTIWVTLRRGAANLTIVVEDNGVGRREGAQAGHGSKLVMLLVEQSGGNIKWESAIPGCRVVITIPNDLSEERGAQ
jgi:two-component sensor histidine kinase